MDVTACLLRIAYGKFVCYDFLLSDVTIVLNPGTRQRRADEIMVFRGHCLTTEKPLAFYSSIVVP